jgi:hypothetical protein
VLISALAELPPHGTADTAWSPSNPKQTHKEIKDREGEQRSREGLQDHGRAVVSVKGQPALRDAPS